jgi:inositol oxygenase
MDFNIKVRVKFNAQKRARMGIWEAMEMLNKLVDESDPDVSSNVPYRRQDLHDVIIPQTSVSQIEHLLQTAEAIRRDGKPDWMQVCHYVVLSMII